MATINAAVCMHAAVCMRAAVCFAGSLGSVPGKFFPPCQRLLRAADGTGVHIIGR